MCLTPVTGRPGSSRPGQLDLGGLPPGLAAEDRRVSGLRGGGLRRRSLLQAGQDLRRSSDVVGRGEAGMGRIGAGRGLLLRRTSTGSARV